MRPGTRVDVRTSFDGSWVDGYEVVDGNDADGYRVLRLHDGEVLPVRFPADAVRRERRRQTWWL